MFFFLIWKTKNRLDLDSSLGSRLDLPQAYSSAQPTQTPTKPCKTSRSTVHGRLILDTKLFPPPCRSSHCRVGQQQLQYNTIASASLELDRSRLEAYKLLQASYRAYLYLSTCNPFRRFCYLLMEIPQNQSIVLFLYDLQIQIRPILSNTLHNTHSQIYNLQQIY